jgi:3-oxoacyl-[acyl-carrier protein] reductase
MTPLGRIAQPEDIANVVAFFTSDASGFMTGTYAPVNGGQAMD